MTEQYNHRQVNIGHPSDEEVAMQKGFQLSPHQRHGAVGHTSFYDSTMTNDSATYGYDSPDCGYYEQEYNEGQYRSPCMQMVASPATSSPACVPSEFPPFIHHIGHPSMLGVHNFPGIAQDDLPTEGM